MEWTTELYLARLGRMNKMQLLNQMNPIPISLFQCHFNRVGPQDELQERRSPFMSSML